jgi:hypothetical protein
MSKLVNNETKSASPTWEAGLTRELGKRQTDCCCRATEAKSLKSLNITMSYCTSLAISEILNEEQAIDIITLLLEIKVHIILTSSPLDPGRPAGYHLVFSSIVPFRRVKLCKKITAEGLSMSLIIYLHAYDGAAVHLQHEELPSW